MESVFIDIYSKNTSEITDMPSVYLTYTNDRKLRTVGGHYKAQDT